MADKTPLYQPAYSGSHALVIGINNYKRVSPLAHAANDAKAVSNILTKKFGFPASNVTLLTDGKATRSAIMERYLRFATSEDVRANDRILIFFAGHGHTVHGRREAGFLVPVDGSPEDISSLIRWDELTRNADLIAAKHMLFLMDACYGGLAVTRRIPPGSSRYLEDMLTRVTRQVVTAGKADETVSDGGGTRPQHSLFTSHLLDALEGAGSSTPGVITAMGVMAYVHEKVGNDPNSNQTPHFGFVDGDGDFIFEMPETQNEDKKGLEKLIRIPQYTELEAPPVSVSDKIKKLIPNPSQKIDLEDFVVSQLRTALAVLSPAAFPSHGMGDSELTKTFINYVARYENAVRDIQTVVIQLCKWATQDQLYLIEKIFETVGGQQETRGGYGALTNLEWYPVMCLMYAGGIAALSAGRFDTLRICLLTAVQDHRYRNGQARPIIIPAVTAMTEIYDSFKALPEMERRYSPRSDHMLTAMQPVIEDELFVGRKYDALFDNFEILLALVFADIKASSVSPFWGPPGRFAWKENSFNEDGGPFTKFVENAKQLGQSWPALKEGFFRGSPARFGEVADGYKAIIARLHWY